MSYRTSRSSGYGHRSLTEPPEVPGIRARAYRAYRRYGQVEKCCTRTPGIVARAYRSYGSSGYGYECRTELTELRSFLYGYGCCTELTEVPGTGNTRLNTCVRGRSSIWSGGFHPTCMACSNWANVPEAIRSCVGIIDDHCRGDKS